MSRHSFDKSTLQEGDHPAQALSGRCKFQGPSWVLLLLLLSVVCGFAQEQKDAWRVWLEPRFMRQPAASPVPNAQRTDFAAGVLRDGELQPFSRDGWKAVGGDWEQFMAQARINAAADLATLKPEYTRNKRKVIEYATVRSPQPIVASAVLAPGFLRMFEDTLGPKVIVAVPNRFVAFVFPALASNYTEYAPMIFREYRETTMPVSVEVFEISAEGVRAIGIFEEP